jgi:hypothetical protein
MGSFVGRKSILLPGPGIFSRINNTESAEQLEPGSCSTTPALHSFPRRQANAGPRGFFPRRRRRRSPPQAHPGACRSRTKAGGKTSLALQLSLLSSDGSCSSNSGEGGGGGRRPATRWDLLLLLIPLSDWCMVVAGLGFPVWSRRERVPWRAGLRAAKPKVVR